MARILIVDDDALLLLTTASALEGLGHEVTRCGEPLKAADIVEKTSPHIAVLDYAMPLLKGPELLARIRQGAYGKSLPVIFLSGTDPLRYAHSIPPDPRVVFLKKPATIADLTDAITNLLDPDGWSQNH